MSFIKIAYSEHAVIDAFDNEPKIVEDGLDAKQAALQFRNTVAAVKKSIKKSNDFLYVRTRAIGSLEKWGPNLNGDGFPFKELEASYTTFVGRGNFLDHKSDDIRMIRGLVIDAYLNKDDQAVECLIAVDRVSHAQLARHIETGIVNSVSMGTRVGVSNCSVCGHEARTEDQYCSHISGYKGMKVGFLINNAAHKFGKWPVHEINHELEFIELSWVSVPAFKEANVLERIASVREAALENKSFEQSEAEKELETFASSFYKNKMEVHHTKMADPSAKATTKEDLENKIPSSLQEINERAQCLNESECSTDPRKQKTEVKMNTTKTAAGMQRIKITVDEISFRKGYNDFTSEGTVTINEKEYSWWASSSDKNNWTVNLDEDATGLISAKGNDQIINAVEQLLTKNVNDTELIIASGEFFMKTAYLQGSEDPLMKTQIDVRTENHETKPIYDVKSLEVSTKIPVRETELENYSKTAKEGPAGAIGKSHEITENTSKEEVEEKKMLQRAYLEYLNDERKLNKKS